MNDNTSHLNALQQYEASLAEVALLAEPLRSYMLTHLAREVRTVAWSGPYRPQAEELINSAEEKVDRNVDLLSGQEQAAALGLLQQKGGAR